MLKRSDKVKISVELVGCNEAVSETPTEYQDRNFLLVTDSVDLYFQLQNKQLRIRNILWNPFLDCHEVTFVETMLTRLLLINKKQSVVASTESVTSRKLDSRVIGLALAAPGDSN